MIAAAIRNTEIGVIPRKGFTSMAQIEWKIDLGHIITFGVLIGGFAVQYGSLSNRLTVVEIQAAKAAATNEQLNQTLMNLQNTIVRVQTQMDEREKRFDAGVAEQAFKEDRKLLRK